MKFFTVFALLMACFGCYSAQDGMNFYCGRHLSRTLAMLCEGSESKRAGGWWVPPQSARALGGMRGKRGPVDECCNKPCSVDELLTYCWT